MDLSRIVVVDAGHALWVVIANALVAWSAWRLSGRAKSDDRLPQRLMRAVLVWVAAIVLIATALGACGVLYGWALALAGASFSIVAAGVVWSGKHGHSPAVSERVANRYHNSADVPRAPVDKSEQAMWAGWCVQLALLLGHVVVNGLLRFPEEFDGLAYHIPLIDHWLQAKSLYAPNAAWWWSPANAEVVGLWLVAPFSGDFLIALSNLPFIVLWVFAALEAGRLVGLSVVWRHLTALAMVAVHTTFYESEKAMNDVAVAACFFAALAYGLRHLRSRQSCDGALAGVALGLLIGIKYYALGHAVLLAAAIVAAVYVALGLRDALRTGILLVVVALPFGGYWYLRNLWVAGAPLYPLGGGGVGIGHPDLWQTTFVGNSNPELLSLTVRALCVMTGPCHLAAVAAAPITAACLAYAGLGRLRRARRPEGAAELALCVMLVGMAGLFVCTPFTVENQPGTLNHLRWAGTPARYGLCFLSLCVLAFAWFLQHGSETAAALCARRPGAARGWQGKMEIAVQAMFGGAVVWQVCGRIMHAQRHVGFAGPPDLLGAALLGAILLGCAWLGVELRRLNFSSRRVFAGAAASLVLGGAAASTGALSKHWHDGYATHFDRLWSTGAFAHLGREARSLRIAVLDYRPYPFFGSARQHQVSALRILTTYDQLIHYLASRRPDIVASRSSDDPRKVFDRYKNLPAWLEADESKFRLLLNSGEVYLFSFYDSTLASGSGAGAGAGPGRRETASSQNIAQGAP